MKRAKIETFDDLNNIWESKIHKAFQVIFSKESSILVYQELFDIFHSLTLSKFADKVENKLKESFRRIISTLYSRLDPEADNFLSQFSSCYESYSDLVDKISKIAVYYDKRYALKSTGCRPSEMIGKQEFIEYLASGGVLAMIISSILKKINNIRNDGFEDFNTIRKIIFIFIEIGSLINAEKNEEDQDQAFLILYLHSFEDAFLAHTETYYKRRSVELRESENGELLILIHKLIHFELDLVNSLMHPCTQPKLKKLLIIEILLANSERLMSTVSDMITTKNKLNCSILAELCSFSQITMTNLKAKLKSIISTKLRPLLDEGNSFVIDPIICLRNELVECFDLVKEQHFYKEILKMLGTCIKDVVAELKFERQIANNLHKFILRILKEPEEIVEDFFSKIIVIFELISETTLFGIHYIEYLQKRLLSYDESQILYYENKIMEKLSLFQFEEAVNSAQICIADIRSSMNLRNQFDQLISYLKAKGVQGKQSVFAKSQLEFKATVITGNFWEPVSHQIQCLPPLIEEAKKEYINFLNSKFKERKYVWWIEKETAVLSFSFDSQKKKLLSMTGIQACICLQFNDHNGLTFLQLSRSLSYPDIAELKASLAGLLASKILCSSSNKDKFDDTCIIYVNRKFEHKKTVIKVKDLKVEKAVKLESDSSSQKYLISKSIKIESCLIRIMKSSKILQYESLISRTFELIQGYFSPDRRSIIRGIDNLIKTDHLRRLEDDHTMLQYI